MGPTASPRFCATLAEWKRKRDEEELARQREREERLANGPSYRLAGMAYQRSLDNFRQTLLDGGFSAEEVKALKSEVVSNGYIPSAKDMVKERKEEEAAWQDYREGERGGDDEKVAAWLAAEEARKAEETQAGLLAYYQGRKAGETPVTPVKETNWLSNLWNAGTTALAGILSTEKETGGGGKLAIPTPIKKADDPEWWEIWKPDWNLQNTVENVLKEMLPTPPMPLIRTLDLPDNFATLPVGTSLPVSNLLLPPNGMIGLIQPGKFSILPVNPPTTSLGYYDMCMGTYVSPRETGSNFSSLYKPLQPIGVNAGLLNGFQLRDSTYPLTLVYPSNNNSGKYAMSLSPFIEYPAVWNVQSSKLDNQKNNFSFDAFGFRLEGSTWFVSGFDFNLDTLYFVKSNQFGVFISPGFQIGEGGGFSITGGLLFANNMLERDSYSGPSITGGADIPVLPLGISIESDYSLSPPNDDGTFPQILYIGGGPIQPEVGSYYEEGAAIPVIGFWDWVTEK